MGYVWNAKDETIYDVAGRKVAIKDRIYPLEKDDGGQLFFIDESMEKRTWMGQMDSDPIGVSFNPKQGVNFIEMTFHYA